MRWHGYLTCCNEYVRMLLNVCQDSVNFSSFQKVLLSTAPKKTISISVFLNRSLFAVYWFCRMTSWRRTTAYDTLQPAKAFIPCLKPRIAFISNPRHRTFPVDQVYEALQKTSVLASRFSLQSLYVCVRASVLCKRSKSASIREGGVCSVRSVPLPQQWTGNSHSQGYC